MEKTPLLSLIVPCLHSFIPNLERKGSLVEYVFQQNKGLSGAIRHSVKPNAKIAAFFGEFTRKPYDTLNNWYKESFIRIGKRKYVFYKTKMRNALDGLRGRK